MQCFVNFSKLNCNKLQEWALGSVSMLGASVACKVG